MKELWERIEAREKTEKGEGQPQVRGEGAVTLCVGGGSFRSNISGHENQASHSNSSSSNISSRERRRRPRARVRPRRIKRDTESAECDTAYASIRLHTPAYASIRQHASAWGTESAECVTEGKGSSKPTGEAQKSGTPATGGCRERDSSRTERVAAPKSKVSNLAAELAAVAGAEEVPAGASASEGRGCHVRAAGIKILKINAMAGASGAAAGGAQGVEGVAAGLSVSEEGGCHGHVQAAGIRSFKIDARIPNPNVHMKTAEEVVAGASASEAEGGEGKSVKPPGGGYVRAARFNDARIPNTNTNTRGVPNASGRSEGVNIQKCKSQKWRTWDSAKCQHQGCRTYATYRGMPALLWLC